ncbi:hypothetical protein [Novosphingobium sp.]|uniref:hypothetical protein n=1 Tax=Novosphingobium sp. TaxID=1874826 RepID=UPI0027332B28|nr:hypothetical protein [Novosphingobium sp.]MDP3906102.1 hypothetical protein [Novosphingobium sp.]
MKAASYPCPLPHCGSSSEYALTFDTGRTRRILLIPALLDEANRMRRFSVEVMRRLDGAGFDCFLPDLPGTNESTVDLASVTPSDWHCAMAAAANGFGATHVLALRGGGLFWPEGLPGWHYGAVKGASLLRTLLRARVIAAREAGREETADALLAQANERGIELAGYPLSAAMVRELSALVPTPRPGVQVIDQQLLGGSPLWLRAEPDEDGAQADALAAVIAMALNA